MGRAEAPPSAHRGRRGGEESAIGALASQLTGRESAAGPVLAVHWRHPVADYPRSGDDVH
jgi:hypothetical protein